LLAYFRSFVDEHYAVLRHRAYDTRYIVEHASELPVQTWFDLPSTANNATVVTELAESAEADVKALRYERELVASVPHSVSKLPPCAEEMLKEVRACVVVIAVCR
jgi:hypothetical protein